MLWLQNCNIDTVVVGKMRDITYIAKNLGNVHWPLYIIATHSPAVALEIISISPESMKKPRLRSSAVSMSTGQRRTVNGF